MGRSAAPIAEPVAEDPSGLMLAGDGVRPTDTGRAQVSSPTGTPHRLSEGPPRGRPTAGLMPLFSVLEPRPVVACL